MQNINFNLTSHSTKKANSKFITGLNVRDKL